MTRRAHVIQRGERTAQERLPDLPTLPNGAPCDGIAFLSSHAAPSPDLRPLRNAVTAIWRGRLGVEPDAPHLLVAIFAEPLVPVVATGASCLPLRATFAGVLASFVDDITAPQQVASGASTSRWVELWWKGGRRRLALDTLEPVSLASLWAAPRLNVHAPAVRTAVDPLSSSAQTRRSRGETKVVRTRIALQREADDPVGDIEARLRRIEERTRLSSIFRQIFSQRIVGEGGSTQSGEAEPGVLENLKGWLRWHTPLGAGLRGKFSERMAMVEGLLAKGDLDTALKLALALGANQQAGKRSPLPSALPGLRRSLDLTVTRGGAAPILGSGVYGNLRERYANLAKTLESQGDFRRAAYVRSKLLNDHREAALVLERGGLFREAAKLAMEAELEPPLTIRLLFKADELAAALGLAKRAGCFDQLAEASREQEPAFHAYVVEAWTEALLATNQPLRALQVTDRLAGHPQAPQSLLDDRRRWLDRAAALEEPSSPAPETLARALLAGSWENEGAWEDFPQLPGRSGPVGALRDTFARAVRAEGQTPENILVEALQPLARLAGPDRQEQSEFWQGPAQPILEAFALALIGQASERLGGGDLEALRSLLEQAELPVLAFDLGKLSKLHARPSPKSRTWRVPPASAVQPAIRVACALGAGQVLAWRESRLMQLFDRHGGVVWQQNVSDIVALVPIGTSPDVIVVQSTPDGAHQLTRFASHRRSFHPVGKVRLSACHDITSEGQWLVQIGGEIGAVDLVKLCLPSPEIELLWSSQVTERLRAIAFAHAPDRPQWLTRDISEGRAGVLERWTLERGDKLTTTVCVPRATASDGLRQPEPWFWAPQLAGNPIRTTDARNDALWTAPWTVDVERQAVDYARKRLAENLEGRDVFQSCDFGRPYVRVEAGETVRTSIVQANAPMPRFTFEHAITTRLTCLARSGADPMMGNKDAARHPGRAVFADDDGRMFVVDLETLNLIAL